MTVVLAAVWAVACGQAAGQLFSVGGEASQQSGDWVFERVELPGGRVYRGYIESQDDYWVHITEIHRPRGRPMYLVIRPVRRVPGMRVVRLPAEQRAELRSRIDAYVHRARIEAADMESVRLAIVTRSGEHFRLYRGKWFRLESTVDEPTTRRLIVRVEQIFTAYRQILPPRVAPARTMRLVVLGSMDEYNRYVQRLGLNIRNRACFLRDANMVVAGSELARFAAQLEQTKARHAQLRADLNKLEKRRDEHLAAVARQLKANGLPPREVAKLLVRERRAFDESIAEKQKELARGDRENEQKFNEVTHRMFARLYHEAFHAYLENYVYPHAAHDVPRWLEEGLAMICEGGRLESGSLRIDGPDRAVLTELKADLAAGRPLTLTQLLTAAPQTFVNGDAARRHYLYAWGLAYYLTFEKHVFDGGALDEYVRKTPPNRSPVERFEKLVGMPLAQFERQWRAYILQLR